MHQQTRLIHIPRRPYYTFIRPLSSENYLRDVDIQTREIRLTCRYDGDVDDFNGRFQQNNSLILIFKLILIIEIDSLDSMNLIGILIGMIRNDFQIKCND